MIRVHLLEAEQLAQMDHFLGIRGKSDPYAKVSIGLQHFRSQTIYKNLNPTWNEVFEVRVSSAIPDVLQGPLGVMLGADRGGPHTPKEQHREVGLGGSQVGQCNPHFPHPPGFQRWAAVPRWKDSLQKNSHLLAPRESASWEVFKVKEPRGSSAPILSASPAKARYQEPEVLP